MKHLLDPLRDIGVCVSFLTRVPLTPTGDAEIRPLARCAWAFPVVGVLIGVVGGVVYAIGFGLGLTPLVAATLAVAAMIVATGGLHEDGLADTADGLGGGSDRADKLTIMRDSTIGVFGALAVTLSILARVAALAALAGPVAVAIALILAATASRAAIVVVMMVLSPARSDGLAAGAGTPSAAVTLTAALIAVAIAIALSLPDAATAVIAAFIGAGCVALLAWRLIGGHTGDVLGAAQQAAEIAVLVALAAAAGLSG